MSKRFNRRESDLMQARTRLRTSFWIDNRIELKIQLFRPERGRYLGRGRFRPSHLRPSVRRTLDFTAVSIISNKFPMGIDLYPQQLARNRQFSYGREKGVYTLIVHEYLSANETFELVVSWIQDNPRVTRKQKTLALRRVRERFRSLALPGDPTTDPPPPRKE